MMTIDTKYFGFVTSIAASWFTFSVDVYSDMIMLHVIIAKHGFWLEIGDR